MKIVFLNSNVNIDDITEWSALKQFSISRNFLG